jgi:hypothetical protein
MKLKLAFAAALLAALEVSPAGADAASDRAMAEAFFQEGRTLLDEGKVVQACAKLGESQRLAPALGTLLNLGVCHEREGKLAAAWAEFSSAAAQAARAKDAERQLFAEERLRELGPRLPKLVVTSEETLPGMQLELDGTLLGSGALGSSLPIDPGKHTMTVRAPERAVWTSAFELREGEQRTLSIPRLEPLTVAPAAPLASAPAPAPAPAAPVSDAGAAREDGGGGTQRTLSYVLLGVGVLGVGAGTFFGLRTFSQRDEADAHCPAERCDPTGYAGIEDARDSALLSTIAFAVGAAGIASGTWLLVSAEPEQRSARLGLRGAF